MSSRFLQQLVDNPVRVPGRFVAWFIQIVNFISILDFYLALGIDLRGNRAFRFLRLFRLFKLVRYSNAMRRYLIPFRNPSEEPLLYGATAFIISYVAAPSGIIANALSQAREEMYKVPTAPNNSQ